MMRSACATSCHARRAATLVLLALVVAACASESSRGSDEAMGIGSDRGSDEAMGVGSDAASFSGAAAQQQDFAESSEVFQLGRGNIREMLWSPDSRWIAYSTDESIWVASAVEPGEVFQLGRGNIGKMLWSPDSRWIAYSKDASIWVASADGTIEPRILLETSQPDSDGYYLYGWSSDSADLYYGHYGPESGDHWRSIGVIQIDGSGATGFGCPALSRNYACAREWLQVSDKSRFIVTVDSPTVEGYHPTEIYVFDDDEFDKPYRIASSHEDGRISIGFDRWITDLSPNDEKLVYQVDKTTNQVGMYLDDLSYYIADVSGKRQPILLAKNLEYQPRYEVLTDKQIESGSIVAQNLNRLWWSADSLHTIYVMESMEGTVYETEENIRWSHSTEGYLAAVDGSSEHLQLPENRGQLAFHPQRPEFAYITYRDRDKNDPYNYWDVWDGLFIADIDCDERDCTTDTETHLQLAGGSHRLESIAKEYHYGPNWPSDQRTSSRLGDTLRQSDLTSLRWSPTGDHISYVSKDRYSSTIYYCDDFGDDGGTHCVEGHDDSNPHDAAHAALYVVNSDGTGSPIIVDDWSFSDTCVNCPPDFLVGYEWSPNGKWIAWQTSFEASAESSPRHDVVTVANINSSMLHITFDVGSPFSYDDTSFRWSPDSSRIAYIHCDTDTSASDSDACGLFVAVIDAQAAGSDPVVADFTSPRDLRVTLEDFNELSVTWAKPERFGDAALDHYRVVYSHPGVEDHPVHGDLWPWRSEVFLVEATEHSLPDLKPDVTYSVRVGAVNADGERGPAEITTGVPADRESLDVENIRYTVGELDEETPKTKAVDTIEWDAVADATAYELRYRYPELDDHPAGGTKTHDIELASHCSSTGCSMEFHRNPQRSELRIAMRSRRGNLIGDWSDVVVVGTDEFNEACPKSGKYKLDGGRVVALRSFRTVDGEVIEQGAHGGRVSDGEKLSQNGCSWLSQDAQVGGNGEASVAGHAIVERAAIYDDAQVADNARINAAEPDCDTCAVDVKDWSGVSGDARLAGRILIERGAQISGQAHIRGNNIRIGDSAQISGRAHIKGNDIQIGGDIVIRGDAVIASGAVLDCEFRASDCLYDGRSEFTRDARTHLKTMIREMASEYRACNRNASDSSVRDYIYGLLELQDDYAELQESLIKLCRLHNEYIRLLQGIKPTPVDIALSWGIAFGQAAKLPFTIAVILETVDSVQTINTLSVAGRALDDFKKTTDGFIETDAKSWRTRVEQLYSAKFLKALEDETEEPGWSRRLFSEIQEEAGSS